MLRLSVLSVVLTALAAAPAALAASDSPGESAAITLLRNGISGAGNQLETAPPLALSLNGKAIALRETTLRDITASLGGGTVRVFKDGNLQFAWVCYLTPDDGETASRVLWFASDEEKGKDWPLTGVATEYPAPGAASACTALAAPTELETGLPSLTNSQADIDAALNGGKAGNVEADGISAWMWGAEPVGDGINVRATEAKFQVENGRVMATSVRVIYEME